MRLIRTVGDTGISVRNDEGTGALRIFRDKEEFMKKGQTAAAILLLSLALNGCGGGNGTTAFAPTESSLYVTKEGTVTSADVESYENDYYSADELKAYAEEMKQGYNLRTAMEEASRCLLCHDAPCSKSCPAKTDPAKFIRSLRFRNIKGAAETIRENNPLAGCCAEVCPYGQLCEQACSRTGIDKPIEIKVIRP